MHNARKGGHVKISIARFFGPKTTIKIFSFSDNSDSPKIHCQSRHFEATYFSPFLDHFTSKIADFQSLIKYLKVKHKEYPCQTLAVGNLKSLDLEKIGLKGVLLALLG